MNILAIETSCDETAMTVVSVDEKINTQPNFKILGHLVRSQAEKHAAYGGVFPNLAKREHETNILPVLIQVLTESGLYANKEHTNEMTEILYLERYPELATRLGTMLENTEKPNIDYICVTAGPGLAPALWVGLSFARALAAAWDIPLIPINHMEGHVVSVFAQGPEFQVPSPEFPALALLVSGGHTELVVMTDWMQYKKIGATVDDAVGEAFDKTARLLGLSYPGGPQISKLAGQSTGQHDISLPRPMMHSSDYNFSFSGLKTAVRRLVESNEPLSESWKANLAAEFEAAVTEVLISKTSTAIDEFGIKTLILAGGVAANKNIRRAITDLSRDKKIDINIPTQDLTGDNSLMIAVAGYFRISHYLKENLSFPELDTIQAEPNWSITETNS